MNTDENRDAVVLLVDDDDAVRQVAAHSLKKLGYEVLQASDGQAAVEMLEAGPPVHLLVSDVRMPGLSGDELARFVSRRWPSIPVLLTSGHARTNDFTDSELLFPVLPKPFSRAELARAIAQMLLTKTSARRSYLRCSS